MTRRRRVNWKALRVTSQIVAALLVSGYFLALVYPLELPWRPDLLFQLNPLTHIYLFVSGNGVPYWLYALIALVLLFAVSRLFCGWLCPLGALLDLVSGIRGRLRLISGSKSGPSGGLPGRSLLPANFDIYLLLPLLVLAVFGSPLLWLLDPMVFTFKFLTVVALPIVDGPLRAVFNALDARFYAADWWIPLQEGYNLYFNTTAEPVYVDTTLFLLFTAAILGLEFKQRRFWCRYICPLGALNRLTYKLHPLRRRIRPDCAYCLSCEEVCHFGGSAEDDCLYCMECIDSCAPGKISFLPSGPFIKRQARAVEEPETIRPKEALAPKDAYRAKVEGTLAPEGISRRLMLQYAAAGFIAYPVVRLLDNRAELPLDFIRPPGVVDEARFTELCLKCGECLKVCLTNGLQPALTEAGLSALWTPRLISRLGYCEFNCNLCGRLCPTGAIPNLSLDVKQVQQLGVAYFDTDRCIPFVTPHNCTVCEEHCPTADKAIKLRPGSVLDENDVPRETLQPYVIPKLCTGCGICEYVCPVPGLAAIRVFRRPPGAAYNEVDPESVPEGYSTGSYPMPADDGAAEPEPPPG